MCTAAIGNLLTTAVAAKSLFSKPKSPSTPNIPPAPEALKDVEARQRTAADRTRKQASLLSSNLRPQTSGLGLLQQPQTTRKTLLGQ